ncbi:MAG: hypothetical protein QM589_11035 [Thermomicrobiales bacterium]
MASRKRFASLMLALMLLMSAVSLVHAEDARYSRMYDVLPGFNFRNFYDNNWDSVSTWSYLGGCGGANPNYWVYPISLSLWRVYDWGQPDVNVSGVSHSGQYQYRYYGQFSAGTYHITLAWYQNAGTWNKLSCDTVNYGW